LRQDIRAYLNLYDQADKLLMEEEHEPIPKSAIDYLDAFGNQVQTFVQLKWADDLQYGKV